MEKKDVFHTLNKIDCSEHIEKKGNLSYLSWAWAWRIVKDNFPDAFYTIYENEQGIPYFTDGKFCWVKTGVTIQGLEHVEYLPIMDYNNRAIPYERVTSTDMNKSIQRSLTKACARHGLGLYVYAGEDLPEVASQSVQPAPSAPAPSPQYQPVSDENLAAMIARYVKGIPSTTGQDYRTAWIEFTHAGAAEIEMFDYMAEQYRRNFSNNTTH